jgi:hypothetical protein
VLNLALEDSSQSLSARAREASWWTRSGAAGGWRLSSVSLVEDLQHEVVCAERPPDSRQELVHHRRRIVRRPDTGGDPPHLLAQARRGRPLLLVALLPGDRGVRTVQQLGGGDRAEHDVRHVGCHRVRQGAGASLGQEEDHGQSGELGVLRDEVAQRPCVGERRLQVHEQDIRSRREHLVEQRLRRGGSPGGIAAGGEDVLQVRAVLRARGSDDGGYHTANPCSCLLRHGILSDPLLQCP